MLARVPTLPVAVAPPPTLLPRIQARSGRIECLRHRSPLCAAENGDNSRKSGKRLGGKIPWLSANRRSLEWGSVEPSARRLAKYLWRGGWIAWWSQLILTAVSTVTLMFSATVGGGIQYPFSSGLVTASAALISVLVSWLWMYRYTRMALTLADGKQDASTAQQIVGATRAGVTMNMIGVGLALISGEQIVGTLVADALSQGRVSMGPYGGFETRPSLTLEAFVLQSNTNIQVASFVGLLTSWLINQVAVKFRPPEISEPTTA
ncbi:hypothetical protein AAMO2058_000192400 [Amorphochlora amoebiformis]|uniref:DUF3611 family protein n=1 Tax=Amorphochlora amoebiformis TaxID=1561963 RepID=A0A7S0H386_9EUKA|mmetsp:Transcript_30517/g.48968  ORF Transcript_30517/g.48968 Transcript_30517/m.48968 type:complete len:263 (+) Transcript_30517:18-806(+)